jgi:CRP-like cAMP-binding protein
MITIMWQNFPIFEAKCVRRLNRGDIVFRSGSNVTDVFLVRSGRITLVRSLPSGQQVVLQRASPGHIVAEASVYAQRYHCDGLASEASELVSMPRKSFLNALRSDAHLSEAWAAHLAQGVQQARMRAEIRSLKTVAERLDAWTAEYGKLPKRGQWQGLADELSVSREALYREMARRRS